MGSPIIQAFITTSDDSGAKKLSATLKSLNSDMKDSAKSGDNVGRSVDNVGEKLGSMGERKLGRIVFRDLAMNAVGAAESVNATASAAEALSGGLEIVGRIALGFSGTIGIAILAITALVTLINKLSAASKETADTIKTSSEKLLQEVESTKKATDALVKLNAITSQQASQLRNLKSLREEELKDLITKIAKQEQIATLEVEEFKRAAQNVQWKRGQGAANADLNRALEKQVGLQNELIALNSAANEFTKQKTELDIKAINMDALRAAGIESIFTADRSYFDVLSRRDQLERRNLELQMEINKTDDEQTKNIIQAKIAANKMLIDVDNQRLEVLKKNADQERTIQRQLATDFMKYSNIIASSWENTSGVLVFNAKKAAAGMISAISTAISQAMFMDAAAKFIPGVFFNPAAGAEEVAIAAGIQVAGAGLSAALGGSDASPAGGNAAASPAGASSASGNTSAGTQNLTNLTVRIEGGFFDDSAAANLAKKLSALVQTNGVRLVASTVNPNFGTLP